MSIASPFHKGEQRVQTAMGVRERIESWAQQVVRDHMPEQHREFYTALPFIVVAARDDEDRPWASLLADKPGFVHSPNPRLLQIKNTLVPGDALANAISAGTPVGLLGIEFSSARRNRMNGYVSENDTDSINIRVEQAFGNCPQYIHHRQWYLPTQRSTPASTSNEVLSSDQVQMIAAASTFFIASGFEDNNEDPATGMDASHRGGEAGFVTVLDNQTLVWPDFSGNNHFNTVGNLVEDPRVGMTFVDFASGRVLQISGRAEIDWDSSAVAAAPGAQRLIKVRIDAIVDTHEALALRWHESASDQQLKVMSKIRESDDVTSFYLHSNSAQPLQAFQAGQHLPIKLTMGAGERVTRTYSLSDAPMAGHYRLSVKREAHGRVSQYLHDQVKEGDFISAQQPSGDFLYQHNKQPAVLISAGVGITPMISMLADITKKYPSHPLWFFHQARNSHHHPLADEVARFANKGAETKTIVKYSQPLNKDKPDLVGRLTADDLRQQLPDLKANFYICGPKRFMAELQQGLEKLGVSASQIHSESFGH
jgi:ferredoxin-NADP reductase/predicted pyridoxine 5'-phosphate oxidase superfamily flavin-nucleotide-binding protein